MTFGRQNKNGYPEPEEITTTGHKVTFYGLVVGTVDRGLKAGGVKAWAHTISPDTGDASFEIVETGQSGQYTPSVLVGTRFRITAEEVK